MCMQDLAISNRVTWRVYVPTVTLAGQWAQIGISPFRFALIVFDNSNGVVPQVRMPPGVGGAIINRHAAGAYTTPAVATIDTGLDGLISIRDYPGIFGVELTVISDPLFLKIWEAVYDTDLDKAVQHEQRKIEHQARG